MWFKIDQADIDKAYEGAADVGQDFLNSTVTISLTTKTNTQLLSISNNIASAKALGYAKESWELIPVMWLLAFILFCLIVIVFFKKN
jgi:hypothetical protein